MSVGGWGGGKLGVVPWAGAPVSGTDCLERLTVSTNIVVVTPEREHKGGRGGE